MQHQTTNAATVSERRLTLKSRDGVQLGATLFEPHGRVKANLVIHGALAVPQRFYSRFAHAMANAGLRVLTYDYRGIGLSRPRSLRGYDANLTDWAERDLPASTDFLSRHHADVPTVAVGHSFGGQMLAVDDSARKALSGAFLVASQSGYCGTFEGRYRFIAGLLWYGILPVSTRVFGYLPGFTGVGTDLPRGCAEQWSTWCKSEHYFLSTHPHYAQALARFERPLQAVSFSDDWYAPRVNVEWLLERYPRASIHHDHLEPRDIASDQVGHFGFFWSRHGEQLWPRVSRFVDGIVEPQATKTVSSQEVSSWAR